MRLMSDSMLQYSCREQDCQIHVLLVLCAEEKKVRGYAPNIECQTSCA